MRLTGREAFRVSGMGGGEHSSSRCDALLGPSSSVEGVKTTILLPVSLWRAAKMKALDERTDFPRIVLAALRAYLGKK